MSILCDAGLAYLPVCGTSSEMSGGAAGIFKGKQPSKPCTCVTALPGDLSARFRTHKSDVETWSRHTSFSYSPEYTVCVEGCVQHCLTVYHPSFCPDPRQEWQSVSWWTGWLWRIKPPQMKRRRRMMGVKMQKQVRNSKFKFLVFPCTL